MNIPAILYESCGEKTHRYDLTQPFGWGDWIYATDGRIMTRCPRNGVDIPEGWNRDEGFKAPNPDSIVESNGGERIVVSVPKCDQWTQCHTCKGSGLITTGDCVCEECGLVTPIRLRGQPLAYDCPDCDGRGSQPNEEAIEVCLDPNMFFMARYLAILNRHGVESMAISRNQKVAATFQGDGFEGWLMPMDLKIPKVS